MSNKTTSYAEIEEKQLRDKFAVSALEILLSNKTYKNAVGEINGKAIAERAYQIADAMLKARKEVKP
ncbi:hypothetical protein [Sphingobacterium hotanense]|uniref:Uncharacterized protein n=1 Tax=Sphingobacterium hotanense TaxID=649196 RepID=A0ABT7NQG4_9SPHI|nr:hypothetical protein [Sphingobacterium hotanense]MDM1049488.1 hypothetical protein [Sphingobacterium hotanense]